LRGAFRVSISELLEWPGETLRLAEKAKGGLDFLRKPLKRLQLGGMCSPKTHKLGKDLECFRSQVMFNILHFPSDGIGIKAEELKKLCERLMSGFDMLSDLPTGRSQSETSIPFIVDETTPGEAPHHIRHG
jgi:hypothetical protein